MPSASDVAVMNRLVREIDQANQRIAQNNTRIANEEVVIARKTQEYNQVAMKPQNSSTASQLKSIRNALDQCKRNIAGHHQKNAQEQATVVRKTAEYHRYAAKP